MTEYHDDLWLAFDVEDMSVEQVLYWPPRKNLKVFKELWPDLHNRIEKGWVIVKQFEEVRRD